ncbi:GIY-YIG nuclease family protein [Aeromicrobium halocynthiae]|uniref:GIY-YIG nuclease family protein n=1 Tax=Aeromicrobium halocynthiae TaxID=560557 RepID=A0ABN2VZR8_9ACTN
MSALGKSVRLFLADGTPGGLVTAEIMNWTGHVIAAPRSDLGTLLKRPETSRTGVYVLLGDDPDAPGGTLAYVGEGDDVGKRIAAHHRQEGSGGKDFWDRVVVLTSKDANLTKAHARYLESRFIAVAAEAKRSSLVNGTAPPTLPLPEADRSDMEFFVEQAKIVLPVLGVNLLRSTRLSAQAAAPAVHASPAGAGASPVFTLTVTGVDANAQEVDGEFVVRQGSLARPAWSGVSLSYEKLRQQLETDGSLVLTSDGKHREFAQDVVFASPSAAAAIVLGRSANGRTEWKVDGTQVTYAAWQESLVEAVTAEGEA